MSDSDISVKGVLVKYRENGEEQFMHKNTSNGDIVGRPFKKGAILFTPVQAKNFINHMIKIKFPFKCGPETVK